MTENVIPGQSLMMTEPGSDRDLSVRRSSSAELACRVETSFANLEGFRGAWDEAAIRLGGSIYMSYDWCRTWWKFYGADKELRIFIFVVENEVVGILPLYIDSIGWRPFQFRVARLVGANIPPKVFDPPIDQNWVAQVFDHILARLFVTDGCDLLSYGPVSELHPPCAALTRIKDGDGDFAAKCEVIPNGVHTVFSLPGSFEEYLGSLNKSERKKRQYESRLLRREFDVAVDVLVEPEKVEEEFGRFVMQHKAQWDAEGKPGHFGAWPKAKEFNAALVKAQAELGRVRFYRIFANGQLVSNQYTFTFGNTCFWELPAREIGRQWDRYSLGSGGALAMIEAAIKEGLTRLEGGLGHYDYKVKLGGIQQEVRSFRITARRVGSRLKLAIFKATRWCVLYGYHKIWYRRISPRLPAFLRKPQWLVWLRLDF